MATLNVIRRWALRENMSIREISRRTGMARNTVKKYLRSDETEPTYAKRVSSSKLDPYAEKLATWLGMEATKSRKQRRNLRQIYTPTSVKASAEGRTDWHNKRQSTLLASMSFSPRTAANGHLVIAFGDVDDSTWSDFAKRLESEFGFTRVGSALLGMDEKIHQSFYKPDVTLAAGWDIWSGHYLLSESNEGDTFIRELADESSHL